MAVTFEDSRTSTPGLPRRFAASVSPRNSLDASDLRMLGRAMLEGQLEVRSLEETTVRQRWRWKISTRENKRD